MIGDVPGSEAVVQSQGAARTEKPGAHIAFRVYIRRARVWAFQAARRVSVTFKRQIWSSLGPVLALTLVVVAIAVPLAILQLLGGWDWWSGANDACKSTDLGCHLGSEAIMNVLLAALGAWVFLGGEATAAASWRKTVRREPEWLFRGWISNLDGLTGAAARVAPSDHDRRWRRSWRSRTGHEARSADEAPVRKTAVGREQLAKSVIADLNESGDPQILVGESGAGKTVLLMVIADQLARQSQVPIAITLRDGSAKGVEKSAKSAFMDAVTGTTKFRRAWLRRARARNHEQAEKWWNWLRQKSLITVLIDDFEKDVGLGPTRRVQALEGAAHQHLRLIVASRSYGLPPDYRRGRVDVDPIGDDAIVDDLEQIAEPHDHSLFRQVSARTITAGAVDRRRLQDTGRGLSTGADADPTKSQIRELVDRADIGRTPYYLAIARVLAARKHFPKLDARNARVTLLDRYFEGLKEGWLSRTSGLREQTRTSVLGQLEVVAYVCVFDAPEDRKEVDIAQKALKLREVDVLSYQESFDLARRLAILESRHDGRVHFAHPTTLAYFASRFLREDWKGEKQAWSALSEHKHLSPVAINALILAVAGDREKVARGCDELLERIDSSASSRSSATSSTLILASAAISSSGASVASNVGAEDYNREPLALCAAAAEMLATIPTPDIELIRRISEIARQVTVVGHRLTAEKKRVVTALNRLKAYDEIWHYARESQEYPVRRAASRLLAHERAAHETLLHELRNRIIAAYFISTSRPQHPDDNSDRLVELKAVAWIFPSVRMAANNSGSSPLSRARLSALQKRLVEVSTDGKLTVQRGLEASVAQGLKLAAQENPGQADPHAQAMLDRNPAPAFWYSRVMLAQALALQAVTPKDPSKPRGDRRAIRRRLRQLERDDPHAFVRQTARLCRQALSRRDTKSSGWGVIHRVRRRRVNGAAPERWESYIWSDAADIVTGVPQRLTVKAAQLAGDIVVALNLNAPQCPEMRREFGIADALPACLGSGGTRLAILGQVDPPHECALKGQHGQCACPYLYSSTDLGREMGARREVSRAFCRHQVVNARPPVWQHDLKLKELRKFWEDMGELARF